MNLKTLIFAIIVLLFLSCENNVEEMQEIDCTEEISFVNQIKPIIDNNCIECHNGSQFPDLRTYQGIQENSERIKNETQSRRMPLDGSLTTEQIEAIYCWIESGALNN